MVLLLCFYTLNLQKTGERQRRKYMQKTNPYDSNSKEEGYSSDVVDDFLSIEEDIKGVRVEITTKIEELILKIEEGEKKVLNKVKNVVDKKVQEVSSKIT